MNKFFLSILAFAAWSLSSLAQDIQPSLGIYAGDTTVQVFLYSPNPKAGLHMACLNDHELWQDLGQLCGSEYGPWA